MDFFVSTSGIWERLSPVDIFIVGYGVRSVGARTYYHMMSTITPLLHCLPTQILILNKALQCHTGLELHVAKIFLIMALFSALVTGRYSANLFSFMIYESCLNNPRKNMTTFTHCRYVELRPQRTCQGASIIAITWKASGKTGMPPLTNGL